MTTSPVLKSMFSVCLFLVLTLLPLFNPQHADASRTVRAGIYNFKPMVYSDTDGSAQGFFVKILNHIAQKENWNVQYVPGTWQEGLDRLKSDQIDLLLCIGYTDTRDNYLDFPKEFLLLDWGTLYKAKGPSINNIFDLEGKTVSIVKGSVLTAGFQELINQFQIHVTMKEMDQESEVFASMVSGSADAGVAANLSGILNKAWQEVERTPIIFTPSKLGFAVNEGKNDDLIAVLDREIAAIKSDKSSIYYSELGHLFVNKEHEIPKELYWVLSGIVAALLLTLAWNIILKRQVRAKTEHLEAEIVERKRAEEIRSNEKAFLRSLIDSADDLIYFKDRNGKYIGCNKAAEKFLGLSEDEQIGKSDFDLIDHELADQVQKHDKLVMESKVAVRCEEWVTHSDGSRVLLDTIKTPIVTSDQQILGLVGFSRDISDRLKEQEHRQKLENQLHQAQKIESVGQLASGIAHEFNNMLAIIISNMELLRLKQQSGAPIDESVARVMQASTRAKVLIAQILTFSRQEKPLLVAADLSIIVDDAMKFLRPMIPTTVEVMIVGSAEPLPIHADTTQLNQVLINLCNNAVHTMNEKGLLQINIDEEELTSQRLPHISEMQSGRYAKLSVSDTGKGMDKETLARIFDPFFTTKEVGVGTGMGLSMVHGIVEQHGGFILVDSTPGKGSTFTLYFPLTSVEEVAEEVAVKETLPTGTERILLVDDEPCVADSCGDILQDILGYKVTVRTNSVEALDLFKAHPHDYDLVITDQTMPNLSGVELAKELLSIRPELPVILCSGYSAQVNEEEAKELGISAFCMKPLLMEQLALVVREVLDTSSQPPIPD